MVPWFLHGLRVAPRLPLSSNDIISTEASSMVTDGNGYAYLGTKLTEVVKIKLDTMVILGKLDLGDRATNELYTGFIASDTAYFVLTATSGQMFAVTMNTGTDTLPSVSASVSALTLSDTNYTSGQFPPVGTQLTHTVMQETTNKVDGDNKIELKEGIVDLTASTACTACIRYNLSLMSIEKTESRLYTLEAAVGVLGGFFSLLMTVFGLFDHMGQWLAEKCSSVNKDGNQQPNDEHAQTKPEVGLQPL